MNSNSPESKVRTGYFNVASWPFDMEDWSNWQTHFWDFNFRIGGYYLPTSGSYIYRLTSGQLVEQKKMVLLK